MAAPHGDESARGTREGWPVFRGDAQLTGSIAGVLPSASHVAWRFETGGAVTSTPVVDGEGRVFVGSDDQKLHAVRLADGVGLWSFETSDVIEAPPLVYDGKVFFGSSDYWFYALDAATGELLWKHETDDRILGGANLVETSQGIRVVVGSYDANLYCFDPATGDVVWRYTTGNYVNGTPAVDGDRIVFGGCDAILHVVSGETGEALSQVPLGEGSHVAGSVAVAGGDAYFGHYGNAFVRIELESGNTVWSYGNDRHPFFSAPSLSEQRVVFGGRDKHLHCVDRATGEKLWSFPTRRKVDGSPVIVGDGVVFGSGDGRVYVLGLADGKERWSHDLGKAILSSPAVAEGKVLIGCNDGFLYAFGEPPVPTR